MKTRGTASALALLFGGIGIHKFYLDKPLDGLAYMLFCWTFIPMLVGVLEAFQFAFMSKSKFDSLYN